MFAIFPDSSPKTSINKNVHLLSRDTIQDTVNMLSTPTRRSRFMLGNNQPHMNDDSPILSQETINISWKWNNEGTPIRPTNKSSKLRRSITNNSPQLQHLQRSTKRNSSSIDTQNGSSTVSPKSLAEPETHSPKGLYKFQEEMRKIQFDIESDTSRDNLTDINNKSDDADTGYPSNVNTEDHQTNFSSCNRLAQSVHMQVDEQTSTPPSNKFDMDDDLLNDSDFDQILLTCKMPAEKDATKPEPNQLSKKKASSAPEIKTGGDNGSNWNLTEDDCFDDLVKDFDVDISCSPAKFTRHKSMPQQPQNPSTSNVKKFVPQQSYANASINRKSFTRHESMPITNTTINRPSAARSNSGTYFSPSFFHSPKYQSKNLINFDRLGMSSSQARKCTSEEIAEKRRQAMERLKNRKMNH